MKFPTTGSELLKLDNATIDQLLNLALVHPSTELFMNDNIEANADDLPQLFNMMHICFTHKLYALCVTFFEKAYSKKESAPLGQFDTTKPWMLWFSWEMANSYIALGRYADAQANISSCLKILENKANQDIGFINAYNYNFFVKGHLPFTSVLLSITLVKIHILQGEYKVAKELCEKIESDPNTKRELAMLHLGGGELNVLYLMIFEYSKLGLLEQAERRYAECLAKISELEVIEDDVRWQQLNIILEMLKLYPHDEQKQESLRNIAAALFSGLIKNVSTPMHAISDESVGHKYIEPNEVLYYAIRAAQSPCNIEAARIFVENFPDSYIAVLGDMESNKATGLEKLANFYAAQDMIEKAIEYYQMSFNLYPKYYANADLDPPLGEIACLYLQLGKFPEAIAHIILAGESSALSSILHKFIQTQGLKPVAEIIDDLLDAMDNVQLPNNRKLEESNVCTVAKQFVKIRNLEAARACYERATHAQYNPKGQSYFGLGMLDIVDGFIEQGVFNLKKASDLGWIKAKYVLIQQYVTPSPIQEAKQQAQAKVLMAVDLVNQLFARKGKNYEFYYDPIYPLIRNLQDISMEGNLIFAMFLTHDNDIERHRSDVHDINNEPDGLDGLRIFKEIIKSPGGKFYADVIVEHLKTLDLRDGIKRLAAANIFELAGRIEEAMYLYMPIIDHGRSELKATANLRVGLIFEKLGGVNQAKTYYAQCSSANAASIILEYVELSKYSSCREGLLSLAKFYESIGGEDCIQKACDFYQRSAMATIKKQAGLTSTRALLHSMASRVVNRVAGYQDEAIVALRRLSDKQNPLAMFFLGKIYAAQGDATTATRLYLNAAEKNNIPAMLKVAQLTKDNKIAMAWYWRALAAGETKVAANAIRNKLVRILGKNDLAKLEDPSCLYDCIGADFIIDPVVVAYNVTGNDPDAHYKGTTYERNVLNKEVKRQVAMRQGDIFTDPITQAKTSIWLSQLAASNELLIPNRALSGLIRYKLGNPGATVATYPGFIDPYTGERFIEPWLTRDGTSVENGHPYAEVPNRNLKNIMLQFPVTGVDFLLRGVKQKNQTKNQEAALQYFLQALALAQPKQDSRTASLYPANANLCTTLFGHIASCIKIDIKHCENAAKKIMAELMSRLDKVPAEKYDILIPMLTSNITASVMFDPVIVANGQAYESYTINTWFAEGNATDPNTKESIPMNFVRSKGLAGIIPFLLLGGDIDSYPGFFNAEGARFRDPYINALGETVERGEPGAMYPNFWMQKIMAELKIPESRPIFVAEVKLRSLVGF